ncbi:MAG: GNAT family N-acetyltransferase [Mycoplasmataceae bacterium]|jgi:ribosomal-protein-alanine N-acetyltransferase|nr:GNAT family N-acetyltransferase [Mycoplasmataceae bacterium]
MDIKYIEKEDLPTIVQYENETFTGHSRYSLAQLEDMLNNDNYRLFGGYVKNELVAYLILHILEDIDVIKIFTAKDYRRQGFASQLIERAKQMYTNSFILEVNENNVDAISFYQKNGFVQVGIRKGYYNNGDNAIILKK